MSAWPEAIYTINEIKKAIKETAHPVISDVQGLERIDEKGIGMRFSSQVLSNEEKSTAEMPVEEEVDSK